MRDIDAAGIVSFARYLSLVHEAGEEMLAHYGINFIQIAKEYGIVQSVIYAYTDYRLPLSLEEIAGIDLSAKNIRQYGFPYMPEDRMRT